MAKTQRTAAQIKAAFRSQGVTVASWATERGYRPHAVYQVLNGFTKATHGVAHKIAVDLGMKPSPDQHAA